MVRIKLLAAVVLVLAVALAGCDKAKGPFVRGEKLRQEGQFDIAVMAFDEAMNANPTSEFAAKAKVSKALALYGKAEKLEKEGKYAEMIDPLKKWVEMDPEKDLGKLPKAKAVNKAENALNELGKSSSASTDTVGKLIDVVTSYDDSPWKRDFWAAYIAATKRDYRTMRVNMDKAKKVMPPAPAVPYSIIWPEMERLAKLDEVAHHAAGGKTADKKDDKGGKDDKGSVGKADKGKGGKKDAGKSGGKGGKGKAPKKMKK
jgi:tetratricopeptide (TPR) repeat protein